MSAPATFSDQAQDQAPGEPAPTGFRSWPGVRLYFRTHVFKLSAGPVHLILGYSPKGWGHEERTAYVRSLASLSLLSNGHRTCGIRAIALFLNVSFIITPPEDRDVTEPQDESKGAA